jgi:hypothetical protein
MPNTIAENLQRLVDAKEDIADAIITNGGTVTSGDGFEDFPADINTITANIDTIVSAVNTGLKASLGGKADLPTITVSAWANGTITLTSGGTTKTVSYTGTPISVKVEIGTTWTVSATIDDVTVSQTVIVSDYVNYTATLIPATITASAWANGDIVVSNGTTTITKAYSGTPVVFYVSLDTWTVTATISGDTVTETATVSDYTNYTVNLRVVTVVTRQVDFTNDTSPVAPTAAELTASPVYSGITRCNVADDGTILAYYGDSSYKEDGSNGQVMVKIPKFYYKLDAGSATSGGDITVGQWYIADEQRDSSYKLHPAFINASGNEVDYFLIGAFENTFQNGSTYTASYSSSYKMASVGSNGGSSIKPGHDFTRPQGRSTAAARGTGWYQIGFKQIQAVQMLFGVEFGFNSQYTVGQGYTYSSNSATTYVGQTTNVTSGDTTTGGGSAGDMKPVCWRGIENLWGNIRSWIDGFIGNNGTGYFKNDYNFNDTYSSSTYTQIGFTLPSTGYSTYFGYDSTNDWVIFPHSASSSANPTGSIGDYFSLSTSTNRMCILGGHCNGGARAGLFYFNVDVASSDSYSSIGARLMYVPTST